MPVVTVDIWEGRTVDQKRALCRAITDAMVEHADCRPDGLHVIINEVSRENWARAGVLGIDRRDVDPAPAEVALAPGIDSLAHLLLQTRDLAAAERFYVDLLGFGVRKRETFRDGRPLTLTDQDMGLTDGRAPGDGANVDHIAFRVRGLEGLLRRARQSGVRIIRGPEVNPYGVSVYLEDPDGNEIELIARTGESA